MGNRNVYMNIGANNIGMESASNRNKTKKSRRGDAGLKRDKATETGRLSVARIHDSAQSLANLGYDRSMNAESIIQELIATQATTLSVQQIEGLRKNLDIVLAKYDISKDDNRKSLMDIQMENAKVAIDYINAKRIEGRSNTTLYAYGKEISKMFLTLNKSYKDITVQDMRDYLAFRKETSNLSSVSLNNIRMYHLSFFKWLFIEELIPKNPMDRIGVVKVEKKVVETLSDEEQEMIRCACKTQRDRAIIELLSSTGMRVSELVNLNIDDVDLDRCEVKVFGKGSKERICFLSGRCRVHLKWYLESRTDDNEALLVTTKSPFNRMTKFGVEYVLREISNRVHTKAGRIVPHGFRRTFATSLINRGVDLGVTSQLLGHENLSTINRYAKINNETLRREHDKVIV